MTDHAQRAVTLAVEMQRKVQELRPDWLQYGFDLGIGIGINTGYMTAGNIGSSIHRDYTVIGHQVNVAARLESIAKPGEILLSQRTFSKVQDLVSVEFVGKIKVKGIQQEVDTYRILI
jgi:class 3 adenylate cyclase